VSKPIEALASLHIGTVESVAPDSILVGLDTEAPQTTALNTGVPTAFPRLNGYVLVPKEGGALVGLVVWLGMERSSRRGRSRPAEIGLVDLPFAVRRMEVTPVGTLRAKHAASGPTYLMERGVALFPSVGDQVALPSREQLRAIVEPDSEHAKIELGTALLAAGARVMVSPDRLFGRHLAVLGNTGSGKSCTVAGILRWSLEAADKARGGKGVPNARFIVLDPNGEYGSAFDDLPGGVRRFRVPPPGDAKPLAVPAWLWNGHEWSAFAAASARVQRPLLMQALRDVRSTGFVEDSGARAEARAWQRLKQCRDYVDATNRKGPGGLAAPADLRRFGQRLSRFVDDAKAAAKRFPEPAKTAFTTVATTISGVVQKRIGQNGWFDPFGSDEIDQVVGALDAALAVLTAPALLGNESEDAPIPFEPADLLQRLEVFSQDDAAGQAAFLSTLILRIRTLVSDRRMGPIVSPETQTTFEEWLEDHIGADQAAKGAVAVLDLSLVPSDVVHVVVAVLARIAFEATQRYRRHHGAELPTVIVLEEAHTFVQRFDGNDDDVPSPAQMCRRTFERIAREGRKFGLGLLLSSQRPSELSPTVLAQCNTFILHRLVNDRDQDLVARLVPDNLAGLLRELPTLPTRHALLLGWATPLPVLMEVREVAEAHRPASADPSFWAVWTGAAERAIDWKVIAEEWVASSTVPSQLVEQAAEEPPDEGT